MSIFVFECRECGKQYNYEFKARACCSKFSVWSGSEPEKEKVKK